MLCSFGSSTQGLVGPESGSVTAGKGDSFVRAGLLSVFEDRYVGPLGAVGVNSVTEICEHCFGDGGHSDPDTDQWYWCEHCDAHARYLKTPVWTEQDALNSWLWVGEMEFLDLASCRRCGLVFDMLPGDRPSRGYIARCDCDEWSHIMLHRDPLEHVETLNKIETIRMRSNAVR